MSLISVKVSNSGSIINVLNFETNDSGYIIVDDCPEFEIEDKFDWTVRYTDNKLVHKSTNMTPSEESVTVNALLGTNVGKAMADSAAAKDAADNANKVANGVVESMAQLGKLVAPLLAAQPVPEETTTTDNGGINNA